MTTDLEDKREGVGHIQNDVNLDIHHEFKLGKGCGQVVEKKHVKSTVEVEGQSEIWYKVGKSSLQPEEVTGNNQVRSRQVRGPRKPR